MRIVSKYLGKGALRVALPATFLAMSMPLLASQASDIAARVKGYRALGEAYKRVNDGLRRGSPDLGALRTAARTIRRSSQLQYDWFPAGTGPGGGPRTAARADIWTNRAAFRAAQDKFAARAKAFENAVATGDVGTIRTASRTLGAACKGCHDAFRVERD